MGEEQHTPAPQESRGIYGFVLSVLMSVCIVFYFVWMLLPQSVIEQLPYEPPQQYWGLAVPAFLSTCLFLFAFVIYPALHGLHDVELDSKDAFTDVHSLPGDYFEEKRRMAKREAQRKHFTASSPPLTLTIPVRGRRGPMTYENRSNTWAAESRGSAEEGGKEFRRPIPPVSDMDLSEVCKTLYGGH